jgi:hypothetical protein
VFCRVERESGYIVGVDAVPYEASRCMGVEANHKKEREVVSIPECFERLLADLLGRSRIHEHHDKKHEVPGKATRLCIVDLLCGLLSNL